MTKEEIEKIIREADEALGNLTDRQQEYYGSDSFKKNVSEGGKLGVVKMTDWCRKNNHWEYIAELHKGVSKSNEHKEKISEKLIGRKLPIETCKKMSESKMGHGWNDETIEKLKKSARKRMRPILQYDLENNFIKEWGGFAEIVDELKLVKSGIYLCCKGKINKSQGYIWKYKQ